MAIRIAAKLSVLLAVPALALATSDEGTLSPEQLAVEMAEAPVEHAALARYFRAMSAEARGEMRLHEYMARSFHSGKKRAQLGARHCEKLAEQYRAMAEEYDGLAELHDEAARTGR